MLFGQRSIAAVLKHRKGVVIMVQANVRTASHQLFKDHVSRIRQPIL